MCPDLRKSGRGVRTRKLRPIKARKLKARPREQTMPFGDVTNSPKKRSAKAKLSKSPQILSPNTLRTSQKLADAGRDAMKPRSPLEAYKAKKKKDAERAQVQGISIQAIPRLRLNTKENADSVADAYSKLNVRSEEPAMEK